MSQILLEEITPTLWNMETLVINLRYSKYLDCFPTYFLFSGEAFPEIQEKTGVNNYNVRLTVSFGKEGEEDKEVLEDIYYI